MSVFKKGVAANSLDTIIGPGTICEGSLISKESICVEGTVRGKLICEGNVVVSEKGRVEADISADSVILNGMVDGHIVAKKRLEITKNGKLKGDITTGSLIISEGVIFEGKCRMIPENPEVEVSSSPAENDEIQSW